MSHGTDQDTTAQYDKAEITLDMELKSLGSPHPSVCVLFWV